MPDTNPAAAFRAAHPDRAELGNPWPVDVDDVPAAVARLRARVHGDDVENLATAEALGIRNEHELRLVLAALGYANGSNGEGLVLYGDGDDGEDPEP